MAIQELLNLLIIFLDKYCFTILLHGFIFSSNYGIDRLISVPTCMSFGSDFNDFTTLQGMEDLDLDNFDLDDMENEDLNLDDDFLNE